MTPWPQIIQYIRDALPGVHVAETYQEPDPKGLYVRAALTGGSPGQPGDLLGSATVQIVAYAFGRDVARVHAEKVYEKLQHAYRVTLPVPMDYITTTSGVALEPIQAKRVWANSRPIAFGMDDHGLDSYVFSVTFIFFEL